MNKTTCQVAIVGCGLGGLAAAIALRRQGHEVIILDQAAQLSETGAGIQIPPNSARPLKSWGLLEAIRACTIEPDRLHVRAYRDGALISDFKLVPRMEEAYGAPWLLIHRGNYQKVLVEEAERLGVQIKLGCTVTQIACTSAPILVSVSGGVDIEADVVLGADGLHSRCRAIIQENSDPQHMTKDFVHRIMITADDVKAHHELAELFRCPLTITWMGPDAHVACYPVKDSSMYNFVFVCATPLNTLSDMRRYFQDRDPRLVLVLEIAQDVRQWPMTASFGEEQWLHTEGNFALLGDACHAMFPYLAQGAAQSVEDGAVLGALLGNLQKKADIRDLLLLYEKLRRPRTTKARDLSVENGQIFHMLNHGQSNENDELHESLRAFGSSHNRFADPGFEDWLFGRDVVAEAEEVRESFYISRKETRSKEISERIQYNDD